MLLTSSAQPDGSARIRDELTGEWVARVFNANHAARFIRDATLAEEVWASRLLGNAARRAAVRTAFATWLAAGGQLANLRALARIIHGSNQTIELGGNLLGYFHGEVYPVGRVQRWIRLAEDLLDGEALATLAERNTALDTAQTAFVNNGGLD